MEQSSIEYVEGRDTDGAGGFISFREIDGEAVNNIYREVSASLRRDRAAIGAWIRNFWISGEVSDKWPYLLNDDIDYVIFSKTQETRPLRVKHALYSYENKKCSCGGAIISPYTKPEYVFGCELEEHMKFNGGYKVGNKQVRILVKTDHSKNYALIFG